MNEMYQRIIASRTFPMVQPWEWTPRTLAIVWPLVRLAR